MDVHSTMIRIANGAGFLGDSVDAPRRLVDAAEVDYLTLEYLAELTLSILARVRQKDPKAGYAGDFIEVVRSLLPALQKQPQLRVVTNAGGTNPRACTEHVARMLVDQGMGQTKIAMVHGDDLLPRIDSLRAAGCSFENLDSGQPLAELSDPVVSAHAYLGGAPIAEALGAGARMIITGRVADASLTVGPAVHEFGWRWDDWNRLAGATVAGHLIECGAQVTGGYSGRWREVDLTDVGYPIAELDEGGSSVITKPRGSGGIVDRQMVVEQLVYEIGDPSAYLTPDVVADFSAVEVREESKDRVRVSAAEGKPAPDSYKVSLAYQAGYTAAGQLLVYGSDCVEKAHVCGRLILDRLGHSGYAYEQTHVEVLGTGVGVPLERQPGPAPREVMLRVAVRDPDRDAVQRFTKEFAPLITNGPAGLAGYATARSAVRPVLAYWPTLVPKELVQPELEVRPAAAWLEADED